MLVIFSADYQNDNVVLYAYILWLYFISFVLLYISRQNVWWSLSKFSATVTAFSGWNGYSSSHLVENKYSSWKTKERIRKTCFPSERWSVETHRKKSIQFYSPIHAFFHYVWVCGHCFRYFMFSCKFGSCMVIIETNDKCFNIFIDNTSKIIKFGPKLYYKMCSIFW